MSHLTKIEANNPCESVIDDKDGDFAKMQEMCRVDEFYSLVSQGFAAKFKNKNTDQRIDPFNDYVE